MGGGLQKYNFNNFSYILYHRPTSDKGKVRMSVLSDVHSCNILFKSDDEGGGGSKM